MHGSWIFATHHTVTSIGKHQVGVVSNNFCLSAPKPFPEQVRSHSNNLSLSKIICFFTNPQVQEPETKNSFLHPLGNS